MGLIGSVSPRGFESILLDFQTLDFGVEGPRRQTEFSCRTCGPRNLALAFRQRRFDHFLLLPHEGDIECTGSHWVCWLPLEPCTIEGQSITVAEDHSALDYVLEFTDIPWPAICLDHF